MAAKGLPSINSSEGLDAHNNSFMTFRHKASITALAILKKTQRLCAGTQDNLIVVWELDEFTPAYSLQGHTRSITCLENVPSTQILISASVDQTIRVWDGDRDFACVQVLTGYNGHILSMTSTNDTLFMACQDTTVKVASVCASSLSAILAPTTEWQSMSNHHGFVYGIRYIAPEARAHGKKPLLFTCSSDYSIVCWDVADMSVLASLHGHRGSVLDLVSGLLRQLGAECRLVHCGPNINPIVIGKLGNDPTKPTVLICGHYDVQPASMEDGWDSNPFMLTGQNGYLYGRGTTDDKGPIIATLFAIRELIARSQGGRATDTDDAASTKRPKLSMDMPNFVFLYQGEGENQSQGIRETVEDNLSYFGPIDLVFISNNYWLGDTTPCLTYGMRGCLEIQLKVDGPGVDLHAGVDGGAIREPMLDVVSLLNRIVDPTTGRFTEPAFYAAVRPVSEDEIALFESLEFDVDAYKQTLGVPALLPAFGSHEKASFVDVLMNRWRFPAVSVTSVKGSIDNSSIIAKSAQTELTLRTVPDQSPAEIERLVLAHIRKQFDLLSTTNTLSVTVKTNVPWWLGDIHSRYFQAAEQALEKHWKKKPMLVREGGMSQITTFLKTTLKAPCMHFPWAKRRTARTCRTNASASATSAPAKTS
ncbi:hypothetical protein SPRG_19041 [Saprolegnia parasitica CBS 223.65]|uniref:Peptidase M20 dimerisation domain-containing protein n=1 Tax=Saprolegnia parasitica (strain CBS 223.65) TaxID=695850 RepID=A0A067CU55_SAPPC|nr:hypothetical protein SPRG_19041 [Saprolegnia parasitica CBS 223.65]KDO34199.1 hypothetical protein SPRG_19041 [Saprolegnia parasitica CBS 223.65]|eukprot:XP_012195239.1 hypothetical protein SPRG_19041 [Saprolegnia parasitica CBS 223.65]